MLPQPTTGVEQPEQIYLKIADAAKLLRVSERTLYRWIHKKGLKSFRIGNITRITTDDLNKFIQKNTNSEG